jgi:hypothetical protein
MSATFAPAVTLLGTFGGTTFYAGNARNDKSLETLARMYSAGIGEYRSNGRVLPSISENEIPTHVMPLPDKVAARLKRQPQTVPGILSMSKDRTQQLLYLAEGLLIAISTAQLNLPVPTRKKHTQ